MFPGDLVYLASLTESAVDIDRTRRLPFLQRCSSVAQELRNPDYTFKSLRFGPVDFLDTAL